MLDAEVAALVGRWQRSRDTASRDALIERFLPMARRLASRYRNRYEPQEDLEQVAALGLLAAIDRFDCDRRTAFEPFAIPTILGELKRHFRDTGWSAHVPRGAQELAQRVERASHEISARSGRSPEVLEIAQLLRIEVEDVLIGLDAAAARYSISTDFPAFAADANNTQTLGDSLGTGDDGYGLVETKLSLQASIRRLPYQERRALRLRMDHQLRQVEIARTLGCSQMQVSRLLRAAVRRLEQLADPEPRGAAACG